MDAQVETQTSISKLAEAIGTKDESFQIQIQKLLQDVVNEQCRTLILNSINNKDDSGKILREIFSNALDKSETFEKFISELKSEMKSLCADKVEELDPSDYLQEAVEENVSDNLKGAALEDLANEAIDKLLENVDVEDDVNNRIDKSIDHLDIEEIASEKIDELFNRDRKIERSIDMVVEEHIEQMINDDKIESSINMLVSEEVAEYFKKLEEQEAIKQNYKIMIPKDVKIPELNYILLYDLFKKFDFKGE